VKRIHRFCRNRLQPRTRDSPDVTVPTGGAADHVRGADISDSGRVVRHRGHGRLQHAAGGRDKHGSGFGRGRGRCGGRPGAGALRRDYHTDVPGHRVQHDFDAEPTKPRDPRGSRHGSAPVLAAGRDQLFGGPQVLPVFRVHAHLHRGVSEAVAGVPQRVRTGPGRVSARHAAVRVCVAGEDAVRQASGARRTGTVHGPGRVRTTATRIDETDQETGWVAGQQVQAGQQGKGMREIRVQRQRRRRRMRVQVPAAVGARRQGIGPVQSERRVRCRRGQLRDAMPGRNVHRRREGLRVHVDRSLVEHMLRHHADDAHNVHHRHAAVQVPGKANRVPVRLLPDGQHRLPDPSVRRSRRGRLRARRFRQV